MSFAERFEELRKIEVRPHPSREELGAGRWKMGNRSKNETFSLSHFLHSYCSLRALTEAGAVG